MYIVVGMNSWIFIDTPKRAVWKSIGKSEYYNLEDFFLQIATWESEDYTNEYIHF